MNALDQTSLIGESKPTQRVPSELSAKLTARIQQRILANKKGRPDPSIRKALHDWLARDDTPFFPRSVPRNPANEKRGATEHVRAA